jgi:hypothetical protein
MREVATSLFIAGLRRRAGGYFGEAGSAASDESELIVQRATASQAGTLGTIIEVVSENGDFTKEGLNDEFSFGMTFLAWLRMVLRGLDGADEICEELGTIKQQGFAQACFQPLRVA